MPDTRKRKSMNDFLDEDTAAKIRAMNTETMKIFLYTVYMEGYCAGTSDKLEEGLEARRRSAKPGPSETR